MGIGGGQAARVLSLLSALAKSVFRGQKGVGQKPSKTLLLHGLASIYRADYCPPKRPKVGGGKGCRAALDSRRRLHGSSNVVSIDAQNSPIDALNSRAQQWVFLKNRAKAR